MARTAGSHGPVTREAICAAALDLIYEHGFEATSLRMLAKCTKLSPGTLYHYYQNKQALLFDLMQTHLKELIASCDAAIGQDTTPFQRLDQFAAFHVRYHMELKKQVFVANFELRALSKENRKAIVGLRSQYEKRLFAILEAGQKIGDFKFSDVKITAFAMLAMLTGICTWYNKSGRAKPEDLIACHVAMARQMVSEKAS